MNDQRAEPAAKSAPLLGGWLTRTQVAAEIGVSVDTLARWGTRRIGPPCVRIGRKVLYRADAFREWLVSRERGALSSKSSSSSAGSKPAGVANAVDLFRTPS